MDYLQQYNLETYIFVSISNRFREQGYLNAYDFFCIVIWKANRAKTKIAKRLMEHSNFDTLDEAVYALTTGISKATNHKERMRFVMKDWGFQLPMATAILTALYPDDFTVYDIRVCDELKEFHSLKSLLNFEHIWNGYQTYKKKVETTAPAALSLRDKDRFLWGRSFSRQLENDIKQGFRKSVSDLNDEEVQ